MSCFGLRQGLSKRGQANVETIMPKIITAVEEKKLNQSVFIDLSTAENWLIRPELVALCKDSIQQNLEPKHLSYAQGLSGDSDLLDAFAGFFNNYFAPFTRVLPSHLSVAPGAASCIDSILYNICDAGEGVLLPGPYWNGFDFSVRVGSSVNPVLVPLPTFEASFTDELITALEHAFISAPCPVRALMITNPHNPLGICYPQAVLERCLKFCANRRIHFVSDEVYALSVFSNPDLADPFPFVSVLSLDLNKIGADSSHVHAVWSTSKDFGQSGFRMGCTVTQFNEEMAVGLAMTAVNKVSALSTMAVTSLLTSPKLSSLIAVNAVRLAAAYNILTSFFKEYAIPFIPSNAGLYVFARLAAGAKRWEDEVDMLLRFKKSGVLLSAGRSYHGPEHEKGWMRVSFAVEQTVLQEAIQRMATVLSSESNLTTSDSIASHY